MSDLYVLDRNNDARKVNDVAEWGKSFEKGVDSKKHRVNETFINKVRISTVFLGIDHQWGDGPPLIYETMVFGGKHDEYQNRCSNWEQAEKMHDEAVRMVKSDE